MSAKRSDALGAAAQYYDDGKLVEDLRGRVAIPTESQDLGKRGELYRYLDTNIAPYLAEIGFTHAIHENPEPGGSPILVAERREDESCPTLLTYGHGDVQPGRPELWSMGLSPWELAQVGDRFYGRGTADNKAQHSIVLAALKTVIETRGRLGFNAKVVLETGEEIRSPGLDAFVAANKDLLAADVFIASDGPRMKPEVADIKLGNRGSKAFDLIVDLREGTRHSGHWGGVIDDAGIILAHAIASITTLTGEILIPEWKPAALHPRIKEMLTHCEIDDEDDGIVINEDWGEPGLSRLEKMYAWTSFIVQAFVTGNPEKPGSEVQAKARARCQIRYSADVDPAVFVPALRRHFDARGFSQVRIEDAHLSGLRASRTDPEDPWVDWTVSSIQKTVGYRPSVGPNGSGGLPSDVFAGNLGIPTIWVPHSYLGCRQHGPDEHVIGSILREGLQIMTGIFWDLGVRRGG